MMPVRAGNSRKKSGSGINNMNQPRQRRSSGSLRRTRPVGSCDVFPAASRDRHLPTLKLSLGT